MCFLTIRNDIEKSSRHVVNMRFRVRIASDGCRRAVHLMEMINGLSKGIVAKPVDRVLKTIRKKCFPLIIGLGDRKSIAKRLEKLFESTSGNVEIVVARFESQLGKTSTNDFIENRVVWGNEAGHGSPNKNAIIEKTNVGTNLMMNGVGKRGSTGLEREDGEDTRIVVLAVGTKGKVLSFLAFPFLFCNRLDTIFHQGN